jgi:hypothetical protein
MQDKEVETQQHTVLEGLESPYFLVNYKDTHRNKPKKYFWVCSLSWVFC